MSSKDFIPRSDATFHVWQGTLLTKAEAAAPQLGIPPTAFTALREKQARWAAAFAAAEDPETRTKASVKEKQEAREDYEAALREFIRAYLTYNPALTDADRENFGLPVHDTKPTPAPPVNSRPEVEVGFAEIQKHTLTVRDTGRKKAGKPAHAAGFEIWRKVGGDAPATDADWQLVAQAPRSPHDLNYNEAESGLRVYYRVRWVNTRGVPGPWSETVSAIIA
jgi:hypothetical protein